MASVAAAADNPLVRAAAAGDGAAVRRLLKQGVDVNAAGADGATALHWVVRADDLEATDLLLRAGAKPSTPNALGLTPVYISAENGNTALLRRLLDAGADVATRDASGDTLLMAAVRAGSADAVQLLLDRGAPRQCADPQFGHTALMWAARANDTGDHEARCSRRARRSRRGRGSARSRRRGRRAPAAGRTASGIVRSGVPPQGEQQPAPGGMTPLLFAARDGLLDAARAAGRSRRRREPADPNGITPLMMAITNGQLDVAQLLVEHGADAKAADWWGRTPLWAAVEIRNLDRPQRRADRRERRRSRGGAAADRRRSSTRRRRQRARQGIPADAALPAAARLARMGGLHRPDRVHPRRAVRRRAGDATAAVEGRRSENHHVQRDDGVDGGRGRELGRRSDVQRIAGRVARGGAALSRARARRERRQPDGTAAVHGAANRGSDDIIELLARTAPRSTSRTRKAARRLVWAQGVFLATNSPVAKPSTMALLDSGLRRHRDAEARPTGARMAMTRRFSPPPARWWRSRRGVIGGARQAGGAGACGCRSCFCSGCGVPEAGHASAATTTAPRSATWRSMHSIRRRWTATSEVWEKVVRKLRTGMMPPERRAEAAAAVRATFTRARGTLDRVAARRT